MPVKGQCSGVFLRMFCHSLESWTKMWEEDIFKRGQVKVSTTMIEMSQAAERRWLVWLSGGLVQGRDVQDTVGIDIEGDLYLRNTTRGRGDTGELKLSEVDILGLSTLRDLGIDLVDAFGGTWFNPLSKLYRLSYHCPLFQTFHFSKYIAHCDSRKWFPFFWWVFAFQT